MAINTTINVRTFNAKGTPFDDTNAVKRAVKQLIDQGGGTLYFPCGRYQLSSRIEIQQIPGYPIAIRGDGASATTITWDCVEGGFEIVTSAEGGFDGKKGSILVERMCLQTNCINGGTAVYLHNTSGRTSPAPKKVVRDIVLAGTVSQKGWTCGVCATDCTFTTVSDIDYQGHGIAVKFDGKHDPVDNYVQKLRVFGAKTGIDVSGNCEGIYISQSTILFVERGIHWHTTAGEPLLSINGSHISASRDCIFASNLLQAIITGNLFYQYGDDSWTGVWLFADISTRYDLPQISQNTIHGFGGTSRNGVVVTNRSGGIIQGNIIHGVDTGIWLQQGTSKIRVLDNYIQEARAFDVKNDGVDNVIRKPTN